MHKNYLLLFSLACINLSFAQVRISPQKESVSKSKRLNVIPPKTFKIKAERGNVHCGLEDKSGNLWFGTLSAGVYCYDGELFTHYTTEDGLNSNHVSCVVEDNVGNILFGTNQGICRYDPSESASSGKSFVNITQNTDIDQADVVSMLEDKTGRLWVSAHRKGIYLSDRSVEQTRGETVTNFLAIDSVKNDDSLSMSLINCILEDKTGDIWFAAWNTEGLARYDGRSLIQFRTKGKSQNVTERTRLNEYMFRSILEDKNGIIWFGTQINGVFCYDPTEDWTGGKLLPAWQASFINVTEDTPLSDACIYSMLEDKKGNLWFCTERKGVWRYDGKSFKNFTTEDGLIHNSVFSVMEDSTGKLWFGTRNMGLCRYDGKSFVHFSE